MWREAAAVALAFGVAVPLRAAVDVTVSGDRVHVRASRASLSDVLDGLARRTRMKVVYEGVRPQALVTVELRDRTPAEAVLGVLEGLGINYALVMDATGTEVETLMIVGAGAGAAGTAPGGAASASRPSRSPRQPVPDDQPDMPPEPEVYDERRTATEEKEVVPEAAKPTSPPVGPLNPAGSVSPFAPGLPGPPVQPVPSPTPAPTATPSPNPSS